MSENNNNLQQETAKPVEISVPTASTQKSDGTTMPAGELTKSDSHFDLKGVLRIAGQRCFSFPVTDANYFLACKRFWHEKELAVCLTEKGVNLLEIFTVNNRETFLEKVRNNYLQIKFAQTNNDSNHSDIGFLRLPLHQFFIAYRDATLTNHLCDGQFPVLSTDAWMPVLSLLSGEKLGELECLLAIGTDQQIENLRLSRKWGENAAILQTTITTADLSALCSNPQPSISSQVDNTQSATTENGNTANSLPMPLHARKNKTSDLLNMLQKSLATTAFHTENTFEPAEHSSDRSLIEDSFRIHFEIKSARCLPLNPSLKRKKKVKRSTAAKERHIRFPPGEEPNTYVTFQANQCDGPILKSHEGMVYSTNVVEKTSNPVWGKSFQIDVTLDYLMNKNKRFILNIWKKATTDSSPMLPCPMEDSIIGFAAIDLTVFLENIPFVTGFFNIVDFSGHINGQIKVAARPLDDTQKLIDLVRHRRDKQVDSLLDNFEASLDINNINLSRAIKRKFSELEEISQRLRVRLLDVTAMEASEADVAEISDELLDEFEHDLNTTACEDDQEVDTFSSHINCAPTSSQFDPHIEKRS